MRRPTRVQTPASLFAIGCLAFSKGALCVAARRVSGRAVVVGAPSEHSAHSLVEVDAAIAEPPPAPPAALQPVVADAVAALRAGTTAVVCSPCALGAAACERVSRAVAAVPLRLERHAVGCASICCDMLATRSRHCACLRTGCARWLRCGTGPRGQRMTDCCRPHSACSALLGAAHFRQQPDRRCRGCRACEGTYVQRHTDSGPRGTARCMIDRAKQSTYWRRVRCPLSHAVSALLCSVQLNLVGNKISAAGTAELARALATNRTLTHVCMAWRGACAMGRGEGHTLASDATHIVPRCICSALLGTALSRRQSNRRYRRCGACEGPGDQHAD